MYRLKHDSSMMYIFDNCDGNIYGTYVRIKQSHGVIKYSKYLHMMKIQVIVHFNKINHKFPINPHNENSYNMSMDINISIHCLDVGLFEHTRYSGIIAINNNNLNNYDTMFGEIYSRQILYTNNLLLSVKISFGLIELILGNINIINLNILVTRNGANDGFIWDDYHMNTDNDYKNSGWYDAQPYDENNENDVNSSRLLLLVQEIEELERENQNCCYKSCYCNHKYCQYCCQDQHSNKYCVNLKTFYYLVLNLIFGSNFMVLNHVLAHFNRHDDTNIIKLLNIVEFFFYNQVINVIMSEILWNKNYCDVINCDRIFKWCLIYNCIIALPVQNFNYKINYINYNWIIFFFELMEICFVLVI